MRRLLLSLPLLGLAALALPGCASDDRPKDPNKVSTIPWNRPEKWESQGPMGGMMPGNN